MKTIRILTALTWVLPAFLPVISCSAQNQIELNPKAGYYSQFTAAIPDNTGSWITGGRFVRSAF
jgi:hypothetical protein